MTARMKAHDEPTPCEVVCANFRNSSFICNLGLSSNGILKRSPRVAFRKHYFAWRRLEFGEELPDQSGLHSSRLLGMNQITHDRIDPGIGVDPKQHRRTLKHLQLIHGRL